MQNTRTVEHPVSTKPSLAAGAACVPYNTLQRLAFSNGMEMRTTATSSASWFPLQTRNHDAGKRAWFSVMEMDWRASRFRCRCSLTLYIPCGVGLW
jgi:hypothetical protein